MMSSNLARLIFNFGFGLFFCAVKCQPTMEHLRQEFQRVAEEEEFCFFYYCNRSEEICATKTFECLHVFPKDITDKEKLDLCLDLIEKGDKSVLKLERSIDVCRYRLGKYRNSLGTDESHDTSDDTVRALGIICGVLFLLLVCCATVIVGVYLTNKDMFLQLRKSVLEKFRKAKTESSPRAPANSDRSGSGGSFSRVPTGSTGSTGPSRRQNINLSTGSSGGLTSVTSEPRQDNAATSERMNRD